MVVVCIFMNSNNNKLHICMFFRLFAQVLNGHSANTEKGNQYPCECAQRLRKECSMAAVGTWSFSLPAVERMRCMILAGLSSTDVVETAIAGK